jgi:uncharacterized membrane protein YjdF
VRRLVGGGGRCDRLRDVVLQAAADPAAGTAYLGAQDDVWDAQKDMALASGGALAAAFLDRRALSRR